MISIPEFTTCCGCLSLRNGSKIIGWLSLVFGMMFIAGLVTMVAFFIHIEDNPRTDEANLFMIRVCIFMAFIALIVSSIQTVSGFFLLLGAYQAKIRLVYLWVISNIVAVTLNILSGLVLVTLSTDTDAWMFLLGCAIDIYFILVVYSYYKELQSSPVYSV